MDQSQRNALVLTGILLLGMSGLFHLITLVALIESIFSGRPPLSGNWLFDGLGFLGVTGVIFQVCARAGLAKLRTGTDNIPSGTKARWRDDPRDSWLTTPFTPTELVDRRAALARRLGGRAAQSEGRDDPVRPPRLPWFELSFLGGALLAGGYAISVLAMGWPGAPYILGFAVLIAFMTLVYLSRRRVFNWHNSFFARERTLTIVRARQDFASAYDQYNRAMEDFAQSVIHLVTVVPILVVAVVATGDFGSPGALILLALSAGLAGWAIWCEFSSTDKLARMSALEILAEPRTPDELRARRDGKS